MPPTLGAAEVPSRKSDYTIESSNPGELEQGLIAPERRTSPRHNDADSALREMQRASARDDQVGMVHVLIGTPLGRARA